MSIPLDDYLRRQLSVLQDFVVTYATIPASVPRNKDGNYVFKSVLARENVLIPLSKWCRFFKFEPSSGTYVQVDKITPFRKGSFSADIEIGHVYIGPHKDGYHFSLSMRVKQVVYTADPEKESEMPDFLEELLAAKVEEEKKRSGKKTRKTSKATKLTMPLVAKPRA